MKLVFITSFMFLSNFANAFETCPDIDGLYNLKISSLFSLDSTLKIEQKGSKLVMSSNLFSFEGDTEVEQGTIEIFGSKVSATVHCLNKNVLSIVAVNKNTKAELELRFVLDQNGSLTIQNRETAVSETIAEKIVQR